MIQNINWPQALAGAGMGLISGLLIWIIKGLIQSYRARRTCPWASNGIWFSAEFDTKGEVPLAQRTTILRVEVKRTLSGGLTIKVLEDINVPKKQYATGWVIRGRVRGDCYLGEWETTISETKRFGVAMLKFLDNGRAVGYWVGLSGYDHPVYGYWILAKELDDLKALSNEVLIKHKFTMCDVGFIVSNFQRSKRLIGTRI